MVRGLSELQTNDQELLIHKVLDVFNFTIITFCLQVEIFSMTLCIYFFNCIFFLPLGWHTLYTLTPMHVYHFYPVDTEANVNAFIVINTIQFCSPV